MRTTYEQVCLDLYGEKIDATISTEPPVVRTPYTTDPFTCQHGVRFWIEPTGEQIAKWQERGTA